MHIMNTTKKSTGLLAAIIFSAGVASLGAQTVIYVPAVDYAKESQQTVHNQHLSAIEALTQQIKDLTVKIENSTRLTEQHTNKMQRDIEIMRRIGQKRQELTRSLARLEALTATGEVFKEDPWAEAIAVNGVSGTTMEKIFKEMGTYRPKPLDMGDKLDGGIEMGDEDTPGTVRGESFTAQGEYGLDVTSGDESFSTVPLPDSGIMDDTRALKDKEPLDSISYNGYGFVGKGAAFMENVVGTGGRLIAMDYIPPFGNILLNPQQKEALKEILSANVTSNIRKGYRAAGEAGDNPFEIAPGLIVRPRTEADALYEKMVWNGDDASAATFWASAAVYGGSQYDPARGFSPEGKFKAPVNMNDVLSNGAYGAVAAYNTANGIAANPYGQFAKVVAPILSERLQAAAPGGKVVISGADVKRAQANGANGLSSVDIPTTPEQWRGVFARSQKAHNDWIKASLNGTVSSITSATSAVTGNQQETEIFVGLGLGKADTKEYISKIMANSTRLSENNKSLLVSVLTAKYNQECLEKVIALEEELKNLSEGADVESIIETLPMMRQNAQNTILVIQNRIAQLQAQVEEQLSARHAAMVDRQRIVDEYRRKIVENGRGVIERVLTLASPSGLGM